ncbi:MAG: rhodanese-like domain-containing protein [Acidobacteria bacterium]|nr:rhodanese-like domain-containing protein [Acidobacteriota bacterium]
MTWWFSTLNGNQRLALAAFTLGLIAIGAHPTRGSSVRIDARDLSLIVAREVDHVKAQDLADWIIQGRSDYRLVDLRDGKAYAEYHIPTAENAPLASLLDRQMARDERIVLYSDGGIHAAQAWFLLRAHGYHGVYTLFGGLDEWKDQVLFPRPAPNPTPEDTARFARMAAVSTHFGGTPQVGEAASSSAAPRALPKVAAPPPSSGARPPAKKRKEGC